MFERSFFEGMFGIDLRSLALFRASLGAVLFADLAMRAADLCAFYTDSGVMPRDWMVQVNGPWRISLHAANGETWFAALLFGAEMLAALALALGLRTRIAALLCFVLHGSLLNRDPIVLLGGDPLILCLIFWGLFLPLGARWSVDAALSKRPLEGKIHLSWASAGLLLQVLSVYFFSALLKTGREWWPDGTAVWYALSLDGHATAIGQWLRGFPPLTHALSYFVYFLELLGPPLALSPIFTRPLRFAVMALLMAMHIGFILCLAIGPFPYISLTSLTVLAGGWIWDALERATRRPRPHALRIYYDRDCGFCYKMTLLLRAFLVLPAAQIAPAQDTPRAGALLEANTSWVVIDHDDRAHLKWPAFVVLLRRSPLFGWLGWILSGRWAVGPGNAVYDFVGRNRGALGAVAARLLPFHERPFEIGPAAAASFGLFIVATAASNLWLAAMTTRIGRDPALIALLAAALVALALWAVFARGLRRGLLAQVLAAALVLAFLAWNLCSIRVLPNQLYAALTPPFRILRVDQLWDMFAPFPSKEDGWFVIPGLLSDGSEIDVFHPERGTVSYEKPRRIIDEWPNIRWHKYLERIWSAEYSSNRLYYGRFLCRRWNGSHPPNKQLGTFKIIYMLEMSVPEGQTPQVEPRVLWLHECFAPAGPRG